MDKGILLFDIDRTIFNTNKMSDIVDQEILKIIGIENEEKMKSIKEEYIKSLQRDREYTPQAHMTLLAQACNLENTDKLLEIYEGEKFSHIYKNSVYPETVEILETMQRSFRIGIYSEGNSKFQNHKFRSMDISSYFDEDLIFIVPAKDTKEVLDRIPVESIIVDDKEIICDFLTDNSRRAIWLNRKDEVKSSKFETIYSLTELPSTLIGN